MLTIYVAILGYNVNIIEISREIKVVTVWQLIPKDTPQGVFFLCKIQNSVNSVEKDISI